MSGTSALPTLPSSCQVIKRRRKMKKKVFAVVGICTMLLMSGCGEGVDGL